MSRVKFNANTEYEYLQNFKILQSAASLQPLLNTDLADTNGSIDCFAKHGVERPVPVQNLIKCKMQDNLEFLQWSKRYWDQYYPGGDYDALARRPRNAGAPVAVAPSSRTSNAGVGAARRGTTPTTAPPSRRPGGGGAAANSAVMQENSMLKETVTGLERERDFYFSKLREIEVLLQHAVDADPEIEKDENGLIKAIQAILYSTEVSISIFGVTWSLELVLVLIRVSRRDLRYQWKRRVQ